MGRELRARGLVAADGRDQNSVATGAGEIDGADKRDRYQKNQGGQKSKNDHDGLLKNCEREVQAALQRVRPVFSVGYIARTVQTTRQKRTDVHYSSRQPGTGTRVENLLSFSLHGGDFLQLLLSRIEPSPM